ncbi:helix-turn-helix domain-containing protein [Novosphingobium cyanobacteriorum]|uniref:DUF4115 domain-containing protein n=1 Tax=Novosphingobium cyanobacteriorum TaxID=3024215 RepID=A0ABT6CGA1_9SPHN|nr:RodZ domain-containing protein [Novosphingobium cyanobacteriorum]MDF8332954.1 DUF4115 domain-containing protein [Novosphingobium cyanobacteriorum]
MDDGSDAVRPDGAGDNAETGAADGTAFSARAQSVGVRLKAGREALGLSIKDIAARTRITQRHVEAVEAGDYASLPGRPYALGFARSYAKAVGLDEKQITEDVRRELDGSAPRPEPRVIHQFEVGDPDKTPSHMVSWLAVLLVAAVIAMGLVFWRSYYWPSAELPALVGPEEPRPATAPAPRPAAPAAQPGGPVVFTALEDAIWVKFSDGAGKQLLQKQLAKGESYTVPADATGPVLWTGRPDALAITIGGQAVPRIAEKEGIVKNVAVSAQALLARGQAVAPPVPAASTPATPVRAPVTPPARRAVRPAPTAALPVEPAPTAPTAESSTAGQ